MLPTRKTKKKKGDKKNLFLAWVCQNHVLSSSPPKSPLLLLKKSLQVSV